MILKLIGPEDEFEVDYWMEDTAPAVIYNTEIDRVWVKGANSIPNDGIHRYFEQHSARYVPQSFMKKTKGPDGEESSRRED